MEETDLQRACRVIDSMLVVHQVRGMMDLSYIDEALTLVYEHRMKEGLPLTMSIAMEIEQRGISQHPENDFKE